MIKLKHLKILLFIFLIGVGFLNCSDENEDLLYVENVPKIILRLDKELFKTIDGNRKNSISKGDPFVLKETNRDGDDLKITLSYSGGCKDHSFEIIWDGIVYTDDPCKMNLLIIHNGNSDNCEALITETIDIDLSYLIGDVPYKDSCAYHIFSTYNSTENPDIIMDAIK